MKKLVHTPEGVRDVYGNELSRKIKIENDILSVIHSYGYEDIQTPTFEYFDVFSNEIGTIPSKELYKFFDKNGDTLCLRPDITPSIARCVAKYFDEETNPIRLSYLGNTFINNSSLQGKLRETTQVGCELMNDDSVEADAEMINIVIESLKRTGLERFQIAIGEMNFFKGLCEAAGINEDDEMSLREAISVKNSFLAGEMIKSFNCDDENKKQLLKAVDCIGDISVISELMNIVTNSRSLNALLRLEKLYEILKVYNNEDYVSFDLGILSKYNYYTGIIFKAYTYGVGDAIVKGGRYDKLLQSFGSSKPAIGFVALVDDIMMAMHHENPVKKAEPIIVKYNETNRNEKILESIKLRKEGTAVALVKENE